MEIAHHFESIHSAAASLDGEHIILEVTGAQGNVGIAVPTLEVQSMMVSVFQAYAEATKRRQEPTMPIMTLRQIKVQTPPNHDPYLELVTHSGAPGLNFALPRSQLVDFLTGTLQALGIQSVEKPTTVQ